MREQALESELELFTRWRPSRGRYTSYPHRRAWQPGEDLPAPSELLAPPVAGTELDAYVHVPFCHSLCNFCGLNIKITRDRSLVRDYLRAVHAEAGKTLADTRSSLGNLMIGGGTPNYLSADEFTELVEGLFCYMPPSPNFHGAMEAHPTSFTREHAQTMRRLGLKRLSLGVQDLSAPVLGLANREQSAQDVERAFDHALTEGLEVHVDLINGLPGQTPQSFAASVQTLLLLGPQGVAIYPLLPAPWAGQGPSRGPSSEDRARAYLLAKEVLIDVGFLNLGHGHFVAPTSALGRAFQAGTLRRNVSAFFERLSPTLMALGPGAQGYSQDYLWSNYKITERYQALALKGDRPIQAWHRLVPEEKAMRRTFEEMLTRHRARTEDFPPEGLELALKDGLLERADQGLRVTPRGVDHLGALCALMDHQGPGPSPL